MENVNQASIAQLHKKAWLKPDVIMISEINAKTNTSVHEGTVLPKLTPGHQYLPGYGPGDGKSFTFHHSSTIGHYRS